MRVLITGGAGFIGSHLCDSCLGRGDEVFPFYGEPVHQEARRQY